MTYQLLGDRAADETADQAVGAAPDHHRPRGVALGGGDQRRGWIASGHLEPPVHAHLAHHTHRDDPDRARVDTIVDTLWSGLAAGSS